MKSISKPTSARRQSPARANVSLDAGSRRKPRSPLPAAFDDAADDRWDAIEEDIDLEDFDYNGIDDAEWSTGDWLADRDLALEIAQRALH